MTYHYLMDIALILAGTKLLGMASQKFQLPQVVGALLAGVVLGPSMLNVLQAPEFLDRLAEMGVIVLMFTAGIGTDVKELKRTGKAGFWVALIGVIVPQLMGTGAALLAVRWGWISDGGFIEAVFVGTILTATSVSITVETLKELDQLSTKVGNTILAAALIDDVLGLVALTMVSSLAGGKESLGAVLLKVVLFFAFAAIMGLLAKTAMDWYIRTYNGSDLQRFPLFAFVLCLVMAYCAEHLFGVADITGAYAAGLTISCTGKAKYIQSKFEPLAYLLLTPIFFASIGMDVSVSSMTTPVLLFSLFLLLVSIVSKVAGCGIGAKCNGYTLRECVQVGAGMSCRGEVALIVANHGLALGVISEAMMTPVIITVVGGTILTPVMLRFAFTQKNALEQSSLLDHYQETKQLDVVAATLLEKNREMMEDASPESETAQKPSGRTFSQPEKVKS